MDFAVQETILDGQNYTRQAYGSPIQEYHHQNYRLQVQHQRVRIDTSEMSHPRISHSDFGPPLYQAMSNSGQPAHPSQLGPRVVRRHTTSDFDLASPTLSDMDHSTMDNMDPNSMGATYDRAAAAAAAMHNLGPQMHHHHHLPGMGMDSSMGDDSEDNSTSMVGQPGMPSPAPRPRGPKLKFTAEDDQLLVDLKEQKNLTWKQISDFFPGRTSGTLQVRYCTKLKAKTTQWTDDMDHRLRTALQEYENERWRIIAHKVGAGATPAACRDRAEIFMFEDQEDLQSSPASMAGMSAPHGTDTFYGHHLQ